MLVAADSLRPLFAPSTSSYHSLSLENTLVLVDPFTTLSPESGFCAVMPIFEIAERALTPLPFATSMGLLLMR